MACFSESIFFETKYRFLHVSDVHSGRYSWNCGNCGNQTNVPHCQLATHCCGCTFYFGWLKVQEQRFPKYWFSFLCLMPWFRSSLLWFLDTLCSFIIASMRVGLNTQLRTYCPWKICPHNANMQRPFFLQTYLFLLRAVWAASKSTEISVQFGPARTKRT